MPQQDASRSPHCHALLKLLSGPQEGAEARLHDRVAYLIGRAEECDIVLQTKLVAPRHLTLRFESGRIALAVHEQSVVVDNQPLAPGQTATFPVGVTIQLGGIWVGVGPKETDWSQAIPRHDQPASEGTVAQDAGSGVESEELPPSSSPAKPAKPRSSVKPWWIFGGMAFGALALIAAWKAFDAWPNEDSEADRATFASSAIEKTQAIIAKLGLEGIDISTRPDGRLIIAGYCETDDLRNRLINTLQTEGLPADYRLWSEDALRRAIAATLERLGGKRLGYDYLGQGVLRLWGRPPVDMPYHQLLATLRNDVPGISRIQSEVKTVADYVLELREHLDQSDLGEQISIVAEGADITATGALDARDMERWNAIAQSFITQAQGFPSLKDRVKRLDAPLPAVQSGVKPVAKVAKEPAPLRIAIRGVMIGPNRTPYALLYNGMRIAEGDRVKGHYIVEKIELNRVIVRDGSQKMVYYIGDSTYDRTE